MPQFHPRKTCSCGDLIKSWAASGPRLPTYSFNPLVLRHSCNVAGKARPFGKPFLKLLVRRPTTLSTGYPTRRQSHPFQPLERNPRDAAVAILVIRMMMRLTSLDWLINDSSSFDVYRSWRHHQHSISHLSRTHRYSCSYP